MRQRGLRICAVTAIGLGMEISAAFGQSLPQGDISAGVMNVGGTMNGGNVQLTASIGGRWSLVGEVDLSKGRDCTGCETVYRDRGFLGGVRYSWRTQSRVSPFWQILVGALHSKADGHYYDTIFGRRYQEGFTVTYRAFQPGVGFTAMATSRFGVRVQADAQLASSSEYGSSTVFPRVVAGGVFRLWGGR